jgi:ribosomal protein S18 acetylase RimI-like enzyme
MNAIIRPAAANDLDAVRGLFREYQQFLGVDLCFQEFEQELAALPGKYAPPEGALLLAFAGLSAVGCVALRALAPAACEMKRLYVKPACRGQGLGRSLAVAIIGEARDRGYACIRLDTLDFLTAAMRLYESLGFVQVEPYYHNPLPGVVFWELNLNRTALSG